MSTNIIDPIQGYAADCPLMLTGKPKERAVAADLSRGRCRITDVSQSCDLFVDDIDLIVTDSLGRQHRVEVKTGGKQGQIYWETSRMYRNGRLHYEGWSTRSLADTLAVVWPDGRIGYLLMDDYRRAARDYTFSERVRPCTVYSTDTRIVSDPQDATKVSWGYPIPHSYIKPYLLPRE